MSTEKLRARELDALHRDVLRRVKGRVLEIGPGKGRFLDGLAPGIDWVGIEPGHRQRQALAVQTARRGLPAPIDATAERLPVPDGSVDTVLGMYVLCSIPDVAQALREAHRVLRPGGQALFVEHVGADHGTVLRALQRMMTPITRRVDQGCHLDRDTETALLESRFLRVAVRHFRCWGQPLLVAQASREPD